MATIKPKFFGKMEGGKLVITDREQFELYLQKFKDDTEMEVIVSRKYKRRTSGQADEATNFNGYYWAIIIRMVGDEMGEIDDSYTDDMLQMEVGNVRRTPGGKDVPAGHKEMSGGEFSDYCGKCRIWASKNLKLSIPEPNEVAWE